MSEKSHIQVDWEEREFTQEIVQNMRKISEFLNKFGTPSFYFLVHFIILFNIIFFSFYQTNIEIRSIHQIENLQN